jgi:phosphate transport system protein
MHRTPHVDQHYEAEIQYLSTHLVKTGVRAEGMIRDAVRALLDRDAALARSVVVVDRELNRLEVETDDLCVRLLARRSPVGADLRLVTCALKVVIDMERIGDLASNIAKRSLEINDQPGLEATREVEELGSAAVDLTSRAIRALHDRDPKAARAVKLEDRRLDELNKQVFTQMIHLAKDHPDQLERALAFTSVSRHLERVGDHAANIAEMVVYLVEGKVVRHQADDV